MIQLGFTLKGLITCNIEGKHSYRNVTKRNPLVVIGILAGKKKSLGPKDSGSEQLSLAKQNAQKIKNVVHRLSLSSKAPVLSKRQLKMMQDN